jgi:hypothetical protein
MTHVCPARELAADTYLLKLQRLKVHTGSRFAHGFQPPETKLCRKQAELIPIDENGHVRSIEQGEAKQKIRSLN